MKHGQKDKQPRIPQPPSRQLLLITHRGFGKKGPIAENTLPAFEKSTKLGFTAHELDVRTTKDDIPVLFHGPRLQRTTSGKGRLENFTLDQLAPLDWGRYLRTENDLKKGHDPLTTLETYFRQIPPHILTNVEIKRDICRFGFKNEKASLATIMKMKREDAVIVSSFHLLSLLYYRLKAPNIARGVLVENTAYLPMWLLIMRALAKPRTIHLPYKACKPRRVAALQKKGYAIVAWVANSEQEIENLKTMQINYAITDNMELIEKYPPAS